ncbi:gypsy/ty3 retroelement polyprotein [Tanacetum coccineum]
MAHATRAIATTSNNEEGNVNTRLNSLEETLEQMRISMQNLVNMTQTMLGNARGQNQNQFTRMTKVDFPKFSGDDVKRFGTVFDDPLSEMRKVKYESSAKEYQVAFDTLLSRVDVREDLAVSFYLGGLPHEIEMCVRMFNPTTLVDAYQLTNYQEATSEAMRKKNKIGVNSQQGRLGASSNGYVSNMKAPLLPSPSPTANWRNKPNTPVTTHVRKQMTQKEYQEKRAQNLCFYCDQKYTPGHKCSGQLFSIVLLADEEEGSEEEYMEKEISIPEEVPQVSFNALNGANSFQTMRITRKIRKHEVHILVDCGATHNFLDVNVAKQVGCKINKTYPLEVAVGRGRKLISNAVCKNFEWQLQGETFYTDMMILPLGGCEMVLGIQWLATLGDIKCNFSKFRMEFMYKDKKLTLMGTPKAAIQWLDGKNHNKKFEGTSNAELLMFCVYPNTWVKLLNMKGQAKKNEISPNLFVVVDTFADVFAMPTELPLKRISARGVAADPSKIMAMQEWPVPSNVKQLRGFLGLIGYFRRFIMNFASVSMPLTQLLKKGGYKWNDEAQVAFENLKDAKQKAPVLALPDFTKPFEVETDASGIGIGAVLQQNGHPIAYMCKTLSLKHQSMSTYVKEFLAFLMALEKWRGYLLDRNFIIRTDHFSLKYLLDQKITTPTQMKWLLKLMGFDYEVVYKKGSENGAADALSRVQTSELFSMVTTLVSTDLAKKIKASWLTDDKLQGIIIKLQASQLAKRHYVWSNNQLTEGKIVVDDP